MDRAYNDEIRPLLDLTEDIVNILKGKVKKVNTPIIASCGMQSHGKSSMLESITNISLPKGDGTITICPIKIYLRESKTNEEYAKIKFKEDSYEKYEKIELEIISDKINEYQKKVKEENNISDEEIQLFDKVIQVEVNRKKAQNLNLIDLPGITTSQNLQEQSENIFKKYLKDEESKVLLVLSAAEEPNTFTVINLMRDIPNYKKRFIPIITKADSLKEKDINIYLRQIDKLELENKPTLIINKSSSYENLSYEERKKKEKDLITEIPNINNYPEIYKGIDELINHLVEIQRKEILKWYSDNIFLINKEILDNEKQLKTLPGECNNIEDAFKKLEDCINIFKKSLTKKTEIVEFKEDGSKKEDLMKYHIDLKFREHIQNTKIKMSELFSKSFCEEVKINIIQTNSDNISILEDNVRFNTLIKPKIIDILNGFELTIDDIFYYMNKQISSLIDNSFNAYYNLKISVLKIFNDYAQENKNKVENWYNEIYKLETENILTYNIDLNNKSNYINKHVDYFLGKKRKNEKEDGQTDEDANDIEESKNNILINITEDILKKDYGKAVKDVYLGLEKRINKLEGIISNYEKEREEKKTENISRIKIAYRPQEMISNDDKIENPDYAEFYDEKQYEFIAGFQYIDKSKLDNFIELIKEREVHPITANTITKMISYLEVMLNRDLDIFFSTIKYYLYEKLTNGDMIKHINDQIHLFIKSKEYNKLFEISHEIAEKRIELQNNVEKLNEVKIKYFNLKEIKNTNNINSIKNSDE